MLTTRRGGSSRQGGGTIVHNRGWRGNSTHASTQGAGGENYSRGQMLVFYVYVKLAFKSVLCGYRGLEVHVGDHLKEQINDKRSLKGPL